MHVPPYYCGMASEKPMSTVVRAWRRVDWLRIKSSTKERALLLISSMQFSLHTIFQATAKTTSQQEGVINV